MKIAIDCRLWNQGGVGRYIRNLVWELLKIDQKNHYILYCLDNPQSTIHNLPIANYELRITSSKWHSFSEQINFWRELENNDYDLVHFPYFSHPTMYKRPFVVTIHDLTILHYATGKATTRNGLIYQGKRLGYKKVLSHGIYKSNKIIVPSQSVKKDLLQNYTVSEDKIRITYEGVGQDLVEAKAASPFPSSANQVTNPFFLYVGNYYPHKNVEFLLKTLSQKSLRGTVLVLAGPDDFFTKRIKVQVTQLNLEKRAVFVLKPSDSQLKWLYQSARALIIPSLFEGFGLPVVEAAYFDCPMLLSDIPVLREIAPSNALFFSPKKEEDFIKKINALGAKSYELGVKKSDKTKYFNKFSFKPMAKETLEIYEKAT